MAAEANTMVDRPAIISNSQHHLQNPLQLLELLAKGFCPTIIRDRVEIHESPTGRLLDETASETGLPNSPASISTAAAPPTTAQIVSNQDDHHHHHHEKPIFEIGERSPSDVLEISKRMWQGFCCIPHPYSTSSNNAVHHRNSQQQQQQQPPNRRRGFCSTLTDHCHAILMVDDTVPEREEMSVSTEGSNSSVDLSPISSSTTSLQEQSTLTTRNKLGRVTTMPALQEEDEEDVPLTEYQVNRSHRGIQVLVATLLAMCLTFALLQNWNAVNQQKIHFVLQPKQSYHQQLDNDENTNDLCMRWRSSSLGRGIRLARKDDNGRLSDVSVLTKGSNALPSKVKDAINNENFVLVVAEGSDEMKTYSTFLSSPLGQAIRGFLDQDDVLI